MLPICYQYATNMLPICYHQQQETTSYEILSGKVLCSDLLQSGCAPSSQASQASQASSHGYRKKTYHDYHEHNIILYIYCNINCPQMFIINIHDIIYYNTIMNYYNMKHGQQKLHVALIRSALNKISWASEHCKGLQTNQP